MKQTLRITILMFGIVGTYISAAVPQVPQVPAPDGGPILTCPAQQQLQSKCSNNGGLPPA